MCRSACVYFISFVCRRTLVFIWCSSRYCFSGGNGHESDKLASSSEFFFSSGERAVARYPLVVVPALCIVQLQDLPVSALIWLSVDVVASLGVILVRSRVGTDSLVALARTLFAFYY